MTKTAFIVLTVVALTAWTNLLTSCGGEPEGVTANVTVDLTAGGFTTNGAPGGGGSGPFCCHHADTGLPWAVGETYTLCGGGTVTYSNKQTLCNVLCLPLRGTCP